jgi:hypothetical protein
MLTSDNIHKHLPKSKATAMGHLDQKRKKIRSTKQHIPHKMLPTPNTHQSSDCTHQTYANIMDINAPTGQIFSDQTGCFPFQSSRGNKYVMIIYNHNSNAILAKTMKSRSKHEMIQACNTIHRQLIAQGLKPKLQCLNNKASQKLKEFLRKQNINFQLAPPHCHCRNAAKRAIQMWKNHFITGLASTNKQFPLHLRDRLIPQAVQTLNLLCQSRLNPKLSADAQLNGIHDYNQVPLAPPGTKITLNEKPSQ